jgi:hypothetical protein
VVGQWQFGFDIGAFPIRGQVEIARQLRLSISKLPPNTCAPDAPAAPDPS